MKNKLMALGLTVTALLSCIPASAQFTTNALPTGVALPGAFENLQTINGQIPQGVGPIYWTAQLSYAVTYEPVDGLYTYWYKVDYLSAFLPNNALKRVSVVMDSSFVATDINSGLRWHGQYQNNGIGAAGLLADGSYNTSTLTWAKPLGSVFIPGDSTVLWFRSETPRGSLTDIQFIDTGIGNGIVIIPASPIPEPMTLALAAMGIAGVAALRRRLA